MLTRLEVVILYIGQNILLIGCFPPYLSIFIIQTTLHITGLMHETLVI